MVKTEDYFPPTIRQLWSGLDAEVTQLHARWIMYRQLYGTSKERVDLLNASAGSFFAALQDMWLHEVQLCLSKLDDPATSRFGANMTLKALHEGLVDAGEESAATKLHACVPQFTEACKKIRHRRNKWIAHYDRKTMLGEDPRMSASRAEVEAALEALRNAMNALRIHYSGNGCAYEHVSLQSDGDALIHCLKQGMRYGELVDAGTVPWSDFHTRFNVAE